VTQAAGGSGVSPAAAVANAMALLAGNPAAAERQAREILKFLPDDARAVFIVGAARRRQGDAVGARALLRRVVDAHPGSAYAHHELGLTLAGLGEGEAAIGELRRARQLRRDAPQAWRSLADQLTLAGDKDRAALAYAEQAYAEQASGDAAGGPPRDALTALREGRLSEAARQLERHLATKPDDTMAQVLLAQTAARLGHLEDAGDMLQRCLRRAPSSTEARFVLAQVLHAQHRPHDALAQLQPLLATLPGEVRLRFLALTCLLLAGEYARAEAMAGALLSENPAEAAFWLAHGQTLRISGRGEAAAAAFRQALALRPHCGEAWWCLADMKTTRFDDADIAQMRAAARNEALTTDDRLQAHYALGKALEDRGEWADSFDHYDAGARLRRGSLNYDADHNTAAVGLTRAVFTRELFADRPRGSFSDAPIFIVGMPRAGSTLVEQILVSHPDVEPTMELPYIAHIALEIGRAGRRGRGPDFYQCVAALDQPALAAHATAYLDKAARHRHLARRHFVDKLPGNFMHAGLIELLLPNARIIDVRRHPMAACFSMFKQLFFGGQEFTYEQTELGRYYRDYVCMMDHFDTALPGRIHRVIYEDLVEDTEAETRRLLDYCGLPFDDACLRFWRTDRPISTHSSEQVRGPVFRAGLDRWRGYAPFLAPLERTLGPALEGWRGKQRPAHERVESLSAE
jgi:predicted Zn-dependent protease